MGKIIFITGGVRSGKSAFAEEYAEKVAKEQKQPLLYIASGVAFDEEMRARIMRHQKDRAAGNGKWKTIEVPHTLHSEIKSLEGSVVLLWDCITTWLSNILYEMPNEIKNYIVQWQSLITSWRAQGKTIMIVSNEVLDEQPSIYKETEFYRQLLGNLHQWIVAHCDEAYEVDHKIVKRRK